MPGYVCVFEAEGAGQGAVSVSGWSVSDCRDGGEIAPLWQNHVNIYHKRDKEALFTIWSPFWS